MPFGGRDGELKRLISWLFDPKAASRMLITAPAGRGKSALLVHWMKSLRDYPQFAEEGWQLAFVPISIRVGTNRPSIFYDGLAQRLAEITGETIPREPIQDAEGLKDFLQDQLQAVASAGHRNAKIAVSAERHPGGVWISAVAGSSLGSQVDFRHQGIFR